MRHNREDKPPDEVNTLMAVDRSLYEQPDFPWADLERRLGELPEMSDHTREQLAEAFGKLWRWTFDVNLDHGNSVEFIGRRTIALAYVLSPAIFGSNTSLRKLSERLGYTQPMTLSSAASAAAKAFRISNYAQRLHTSKFPEGKARP
ncbi:MAG TPA: hypothetical protein VEH27_12130 [Methylomirabilota bacterium]|nr:hypothetical protein [Methylomirabilota bacterium]